jgi:hypothetical protein
MQMGQQYGADGRWIQTQSPHRDQRRSTTVDQKGGGSGPDMDAGLKAAAASEGVAGSDEDDIEPAHLACDLILDLPL